MCSIALIQIQIKWLYYVYIYIKMESFLSSKHICHLFHYWHFEIFHQSHYLKKIEFSTTNSLVVIDFVRMFTLNMYNYCHRKLTVRYFVVNNIKWFSNSIAKFIFTSNFKINALSNKLVYLKQFIIYIRQRAQCILKFLLNFFCTEINRSQTGSSTPWATTGPPVFRSCKMRCESCTSRIRWGRGYRL